MAQNNDQGRAGGRRGMMNVDQRIEMMSTNLNLTAEQKTKVRAVFEEQAKTMREQQQGNSDLSQEQRREQWTKQREAADAKLKAILTPDQFKKYQDTRMMRGGPNGEGKKGQGKGENGQGKGGGKKS